MSEFFSLPPLARFRSLTQVAFISQTAPFSSAAAAPGTDPQCALSPAEPLLCSRPCSGQTPPLRPFLPPGLSLPSPEDSSPRRFLFSHSSQWGGETNTRMISIALKITLQVHPKASTRPKLHASYYPILFPTLGSLKAISCKRAFKTHTHTHKPT